MDFLTKKKSYSLIMVAVIAMVAAGAVVWASNNVDAVEDAIG